MTMVYYQFNGIPNSLVRNIVCVDQLLWYGTYVLKKLIQIHVGR